MDSEEKVVLTEQEILAVTLAELHDILSLIHISEPTRPY